MGRLIFRGSPAFTMALTLFLGQQLWSVPAWASCCLLTRLQSEATGQVRACTPDAAGACQEILFEGPLAPGAQVEVCPAGNWLVYQEYDDSLQVYGPLIRATCAGNDLEL